MSEQKNENYKALEKRFGGISKVIQEKGQELIYKEQLKICWEIALNGEKILAVEQQGRKLYLAGKRNPSAHAQNQVSLLGKIVPHAPIFIVGMGNWHYIEEVLKSTDDSVEILVYEPFFTIFDEILNEIDIEELFGKRLVALIISGINDDGLESMVKTMLNGDKVPLLKHFVLPNYEELCNLQIKEFYDIVLEEAQRYRLRVSTNLSFTTGLAENIYHNVKYLQKGYVANQLSNLIPNDVPAIVISAGPSLNNNILELKKAKNKSFIIAVDTALKPLLNAGIVPDMFATIDPNKPLQLIEMEEAKKIPLITSIIGTKKIYDYHTGKKFFVNENWNYVDEIFTKVEKEFPGLQFGGSVATLACSLVCHLGFKTVIFVGQDLAFTGNKVFADGTHKEKMDTIDTSKYMMVEGNCEEKVPTNELFKEFIDWFERFIEDWSERYNVKFINATEGGAKIKGTEIMTLESAIRQWCIKEVDVKTVFETLTPFFNQTEQMQIEEYFKDTPKRIYNLKLLANEGKKIYVQIEKLCNGNTMKRSSFQKLLKKVKKNRKAIEANENYQILEGTMTKAEQIILTSQYFYGNSVVEEGKELARQGKLFMELLGGYADILKQIAEETFSFLND